jgi:membrane protein implicated in regulation of membrane protease activity
MKEKLVGMIVVVILLYFGAKWLKTWDMDKQDTLPNYTQGLQRSRLKAVTAVNASNQQALTDAVWKFKADRERFPNTLQELVEAGFLDRVPQGFDYDAHTGNVTLSQ